MFPKIHTIANLAEYNPCSYTTNDRFVIMFKKRNFILSRLNSIDKKHFSKIPCIAILSSMFRSPKFYTSFCFKITDMCAVLICICVLRAANSSSFLTSWRQQQQSKRKVTRLLVLYHTGLLPAPVTPSLRSKHSPWYVVLKQLLPTFFLCVEMQRSTHISTTSR